MTGVASPMIKRSARNGWTFLVGLGAGSLGAALVISLPVYLLGTLVHSVLSAREQVWVLVAATAALGTADLLQRTPQMWRQVPQRLVRMLSPGFLGLVWGFDLGLLFTTQKTTSLIWMALAAVVILSPWLAPVALLTIALALTSTIAASTLLIGRHTKWMEEKLLIGGRHLRLAAVSRQTSGFASLGLCLVVAAQVVPVF